MSKQYKLWEMLKMAEEYINTPEEKLPMFKRIDSDGSYLNHIYTFKDGKIVFKSSQCEDWHKSCGMRQEALYELIEKEITFLEAVKAYENGKTICCEIGSGRYIYKPIGILNEACDRFMHTNISRQAVTTGEILRGKWYIEGEV